MKRVLLLIYILLFFAVSIMPAALTPFGIGLAGYEKRQMAQLPELLSQSGLNQEFTNQFNDYFNDNFGLRNSMIKLWSALNYYLLGTSASDKAFAGRDGWLYLAATGDDYSNQNMLEDDQISRIGEELLEIQRMVQESGGRFVFAVAPNKNSVYPEYMPPNMVAFDAPDNYDKLMTELDRLGVNRTDLRETLTHQKDEEQLYHTWDTHWNGYGAWIAYSDILDQVNLDTGLNVTEFKQSRDWPGDLLNMVLPGSKKLDVQMYPVLEKRYVFDSPVARVDDIDLSTTSDANSMRVLLYRDSFANQLLQYVSNAFGYARYIRGTPYDLSLIDSEMPDLVVIEIAERNIPELLRNLGIAD